MDIAITTTWFSMSRNVASCKHCEGVQAYCAYTLCMMLHTSGPTSCRGSATATTTHSNTLTRTYGSHVSVRTNYKRKHFTWTHSDTGTRETVPQREKMGAQHKTSFRDSGRLLQRILRPAERGLHLLHPSHPEPKHFSLTFANGPSPVTHPLATECGV